MAMSYEQVINYKLNEIYKYSDQGAAYMGFKVISVHDDNKIEYINFNTWKTSTMDVNKSLIIQDFLDTIDDSALYHARSYCATHLNKAVQEEFYDMIRKTKPAHKKNQSYRKNKYE